MRRDGAFFVSIVEAHFVPSVWDPYAYRQNGDSPTLADFATVRRISTRQRSAQPLPHFQPMEYRSIPPGDQLTFVLAPAENAPQQDLPVVGEGELLFGTMRAYLGNAVVTPRAEWLNLHPPVFFGVKSEFVNIHPHDGFTYFWWAYLRSSHFLENLPPGSGGTRPRLHVRDMAQMPIRVPPKELREQLHRELMLIAESEWRNYQQTVHLINRVLSPT